MAFLITLFLTGLAILIACFLVFFSWNFDYWKKRDVPFYNPFGLSTMISSRFRSLPTSKPFWLMLNEVYWSFTDQPFVGYFQVRRPAIVVRDPEVIKLILTKEFSSFHDRGLPTDEENDPFSVNLSSMKGDRWKSLRTKLSSVFTSGKLKLMFHLMENATEELKSLVKKSAVSKEEVNLRDLLLRYVTDIIGSCAFGIDCNSLKDRKSEFFMMSRYFFERNFLFIIRFLLAYVSPALMKLMPFKRVLLNTQIFFINLMKETVQFREKNRVERNDFVSLMMKLRDADTDDVDETKSLRFNEERMASEAFVFFSAGLESIASIIGFCVNALAHNGELERRAVEEVRDTVQKHDGHLSYEALREMDLIERIVMEGLRLYGPGTLILRDVTKPFKVPDSDLVLDTTPIVLIPVWQMHHDPACYPDPDRFDPDRFTEKAKRARHPYTYLPFGEGPRICIAQRFAMLEMKLCLASLIHDFSFRPGPRSEAQPELFARAFAPTPKTIFLNVEERQT